MALATLKPTNQPSASGWKSFQQPSTTENLPLMMHYMTRSSYRVELQARGIT
ncbi:hypothetical protein AVEN_40459-1, partial [Araneus ventricosus]